MSNDSNSARISPTAHYTGYTWYRHGLSHPALVTAQGRAFHMALRPFNATLHGLGMPTLEGLLLARHRSIDNWLAEAIDAGHVSQVIEIAAGLSPRGWTFSQRYGERIRYIEADLPAMAAHKRRLLESAGLLGPGHQVMPLDALREHGEQSLAAIAATLDATQGTAIVTEGLLNYFPPHAVLGMWRRFATALQGFPLGLYLSDLHVQGDNRGPVVRGFLKLLSSFLRGGVYLHFGSALEARSELQRAGFRQVEVATPALRAPSPSRSERSSARLVRVIRAGTENSQAPGA